MEKINFENKLVIGIAGAARSGKNTLADIIGLFLAGKKVETKIFSFAHALKSDLKEFCNEKFQIDSFSEDTEEKSKIRPLLISYGECQRKISNGTYWWSKVQKDIADFFISSDSPQVAIVSDLRFKEYPFDESDFIKDYQNNFTFFVERIQEDGSLVMPVHISEEENLPRIKEGADHVLRWPSLDPKGGEVVIHALPVLKKIAESLEKIRNCKSSSL
jgi:hypothetical protein